MVNMQTVGVLRVGRDSVLAAYFDSLPAASTTRARLSFGLTFGQLPADMELGLKASQLAPNKLRAGLRALPPAPARLTRARRAS